MSGEAVRDQTPIISSSYTYGTIDEHQLLNPHCSILTHCRITILHIFSLHALHYNLDLAHKMADPPPAYQATTVEPGQLDHPTHLDSRVPFEDTMQDARLDHVSRIGEAGLVATGRFAENDTILIAPAALCRTREISLGELRGQYEFTCSQHRVDAVHAMAAVMQVYENGPFQRTSGRAFSPCMSISYMMSLLTDSPSPDVKQLIDEFQTTYLADAEDGLEDNSTVGHDTSTTDPGYEHSLEACAMRALRFLDGALVAEDLDICHLVYANFTAYVSFHTSQSCCCTSCRHQCLSASVNTELNPHPEHLAT